jgi:hypothetical protein
MVTAERAKVRMEVKDFMMCLGVLREAERVETVERVEVGRAGGWS